MKALALGREQHAGESGYRDAVGPGMSTAQGFVHQHQASARTFDRERESAALAGTQIGEVLTIRPNRRDLDPSVLNRFGQLARTRPASACQHLVADRSRHRDRWPKSLRSRSKAPAAASPIRGLASARRRGVPPCFHGSGVIADGSRVAVHHGNAESRHVLDECGGPEAGEARRLAEGKALLAVQRRG